jgi:hypothetical protein
VVTTVRIHPFTTVHAKSIQIVFFSVLQIDLDDSMVKKAHAEYELPSELPSILRFSVETSYAKLQKRSKFIDRGRTAGTAGLCDASKGQVDRLGEVEKKDRGTIASTIMCASELNAHEFPVVRKKNWLNWLNELAKLIMSIHATILQWLLG